MEQTLLTVKNLRVSFGENELFRDISFTVKRGEALAIVGPNGSGKTVLFRALLNLIPYQGSVSWLPQVKIGYIPQKLHIEGQLPVSVQDFFKLKTKSRTSMFEALRAVGINGEDEHLRRHVLDKPLGLLSGGQWQRIMIAWAIIDYPDILLFDEPTSGIDIGGEETIYNLLRHLQATRRLALLLISHDLNIVYKYANNVLCLNKKMICWGAPREVLDPVSLSNLYGGEANFYHHPHEGNQEKH